MKGEQVKNIPGNNADDVLGRIQAAIIAELTRGLNVPGESINFAASFLELGVNSVLGVDLIEGLNKELKIDLGVEVIFDYKTPRELARCIIDRYYPEGSPGGGSEKSVVDVAAPAGDVTPGQREGDIAIIGAAGRLPGACNIEEYWTNLEKGRCSIHEIHRPGWDASEYYDPDPAKENKSISKWAGLVEDIDCFDPLFFNISPREAKRMDPQQRLMLEESFKAFEDSGYSMEKLSGRRIGVFIGCRGMDYGEYPLLESTINSQTLLSNDMSILSGRISYYLNLNGPCVSVDTACSSSLTAIHLACESIRRGEAGMALAGGVFLLPTPRFCIMASKAGMLSPGSRCKTFDNQADGMVIGETVGALVLKPLDDALTDGDHIYGVIKSSVLSHSGSTQGITAPNTLSQKELVCRAFTRAHIDPATVTYIEIQGTGTQLGDLIEFKALTEAFLSFTDKKGFCAIGSHSPNIGHPITAAGIASVIKVLMAMKYRKIPPFIGLYEVNQHINLDSSPFYINNRVRDWQNPLGHSLRAGIGSFGFNGANGYLVIEEPPARQLQPARVHRPYYMIPLSAKKGTSLKRKIADLAHWLKKEGENYPLADIAYTLQTGRTHFPFRCAVVVEDIRHLEKELDEILEKGDAREISTLGPAQEERGRQVIEKLKSLGTGDKENIKKKLLELADLYTSGYNLAWESYYENLGEGFYRVPLPPYPFERQQLRAGGPLPSILETAIDTREQPLMDDGVMKQIAEGLAKLQRMSHCLVLKVFRRMGVFNRAGERYDKQDLQQRLKIIPLYSRLYGALLGILARAGFIKIDADGKDIIAADTLEDPDLAKELESLGENKNRLHTQCPDIRPYIRLLWICHEKYPDILRGEISSTEVIFPNLSMEIMEGIYRGNYAADYYNHLIAWSIGAYIRGRLPGLQEDEKIRILEIGAGTGGTSAAVFEVIRPYSEKLVYVYTDISLGFIRYGQKRYGSENPFVEFNILDIEKEVTMQGYKPGYFDIVFATNVLHATRDISKTLVNAAALLKKNGWLIANELTGVLDIYTINFGLLEGWWLFKDESNRLPGSPLLSPDTWQHLLQQEGFEHVLLLGRPAPNERYISQHVIIGEYSSPKEDRQKTMPMSSVKAARIPKPVCLSRQSHLNTGEGELYQQVEDQILDILAEILEINKDRLDPGAPHTDFGVDSILAIEIIERINQELGIHLKSTDLFNYPTIKRLTGYIVNRWGDSLKAAPGESGEDLFTHRDKPREVNAPYGPGPGLLEIAREEPREDMKGSMAIAVIGMAARYPGARDINEFWHNLTEGKDSIQEVTRWEIDSFFHPDPQIPGKCNCKWGGFLSDIDAFDPLFFNISPKEAELMDPQHRLFLEEAWKALEDAGYPDKDLEETRCGVFVGFNLADYQRLLERNGLLTEAYTFTGNHEAILSARLSYFLNLKGPGITINTACSTSLVAVHLACESIRCGTSDIAIAGGAQVMNTPELYIKTGRAGMLSPGGKCKTFDNSADGFVPGEGVGVVVLKPLQAARQDQDHIYGVIIGSGINQDGKTSGITAPSAPSQTQLECQVYDRYNIDPRTITYVEAHGTGTRLGDPIEVDAITTAFKKYTPGKQFCAIGSVKTNIGHTGAAAGVTGLIKTLLCLKNKQLVPSIHFQKENEFIDFKDSPFYVNTQLRDWQPPGGIPRTAAVSSFGFSGTNAHVVLSECSEGTGGLAPLSGAPLPGAPLPGEQLSKTPPYYMIPISAKTPTVLEQKLKDMITWLENHGKDSQLKDISYTLLVGRSHFSHRSVLLVKAGDGTAQLVEHLRTILEENKSSRKGAVWENYLTGTRENPHFKPSPALQQFGEALIREIQEYTHINPSLIDSEYKRKLLAVADLYSKGYDLEWKNLYRAGNCRRISLPTYPFETVRCWVPETPGTLADRESGTDGRGSHPLIDRVNLEQSLNRGVVFQKTLEANDCILEHHQVQGRSILPGVGHLEMALAAVSRLKGIPVDAVKGIRLKRVTWLQPLEVSHQEGKKDIFIVVGKPEGNGTAFTYEIKSHNQGRPLLYSRGEIGVDLLSPGQPQERQRLSLEDIKARCTQHLDADTFYSTFAAVGITYGSYFKGVVQAWGNEQEALGELSLPPGFERERLRCILHPCLADGALQTIMAVTHLHNPMRRHTIVPFYVEEVEILHPQSIKTHGYSYVRAAGPNRFHVALLDEKGTVCIKFHEVAVRELKTAAPVTDTRQISFYFPGWKPQPLPGGESKRFAAVLVFYPPFSSSSSASPGNPLGAEFKNALVKAHGNTRVKEVELEMGNTSNLREYLRQLQPDEVPLLYFLGGLPMDEGDNINGLDLEVVEQSQELGVMSLFRLVKVLSGSGYSRQPLTLKVITSDVHQLHPTKPGSSGSIKPYAASLHGLVRSMAKEFPSWETSCIDISLEEMKSKPGQWEHLVRQVMEEPASVEGSEVVIRGGKRYVRTLTPVKFPPLNQENQEEKYSTLEPFKPKGVYCILGGTGGIGLELGLFLARTVQARLVLMDRNPVDRLTPGQKEKIARIETSGGQVLVISVDAADPESMAAAVKKTNAHFGRVNGVFHSAIVLKDRLLENMEETDFRAVLAPKVRGSVVLYRVFREQNLDFIMFFSSAQSFIGNPGQANYAAGCTFKDAFAHYLSQQIPCMVRVVNWGYWGSVGIVASEEYKHLLAAQGMHSIQPTEGIAAVRQILSHGINQVIAIKAEVPLLEKMGVDLNHTRQRYPHSLPSLLQETVAAVKAAQSQEKNAQAAGFQQTYSKTVSLGQYLLLHAFREMGVFHRSGERYDAGELKQQLGIVPAYTRLFTALLAILEKTGFISIHGQEVITLKTLDDPQLNARVEIRALEQEKHRSIKEAPAAEPHINLLWACLTVYPQVLTGRKNQMEVMFPGGTRALVEGIYKENPSIDFYNRLVTGVVKQYIEQRFRENSHEPLNILEVGAGTGGTSAFVLEEIKSYHQKLNYYYTDISAGFTRYGKEKYGNTYPFTKFQVLDIEKDPHQQGFEPGSMDLVLSSNVLHATRRIDNTLEHCKQLLETNGVLVINEITQPWDFATLTFGLTDGWWYFEDEENRWENSPLLGPGRWQEVLAANGFKNIHILGIPGLETEEMEQAVIAAESDGWVTGLTTAPPAQVRTAAAVYQPTRPIAPTSPILNSAPRGNLQEKTLDYIKGVFCKVLKIENTRMDTRATFENYGVDSLVTLDINREFARTFKKLPTTLLFEYTTMEALADYFIRSHRQELEQAVGHTETPEVDKSIIKEVESQETGIPGQYMEAIFKSSTAGTVETARAATDTREIPVQDANRGDGADISIIGVSGRYPQAPTLEDFWENLEHGRDCITEIPPDRWKWDENMEITAGMRWGGFIQDVDKFDPLFFNIAPAEAREMDPQERLFLEIVWELLEDAGITRKTLEEMNQQGQKVGVFVGVMNRDYEWCGGFSPYSSIANRVSYFFNLQGPSLAVDTSCSASLTAVHLACQSIKRGECSAAIAGGINLVLHPGHYDILAAKNMLSGGGRCKSFGDRADGFVVGEGVGAILLKSLDSALAEGDHIYAKIKATVVNAGGKTGGYMVPNPNAQTRLVSDALAEAGIDPRTIGYIEAQATGSALGDPIEITGLTKAFTPYTREKQFCAIGSVKSNIGHLESASGIAGLTKVLLQMKHKQLVPSIHAETLNPGIPFADSPFYVQHQLMEWKQVLMVENGEEKRYPRRAGVSSFGAGGANAHIILEEYEEPRLSFSLEASIPGPYLIVLSARNERQLKGYAGKLKAFLEKQLKPHDPEHDPVHDPSWLARLAYTLQEGRESMKQRLAIVVSSIDQLMEKLERFCQAEEPSAEENLYLGRVETHQTSPGARSVEATDREELARLWVSGVEIPWKKLYPGRFSGRISLPTYPFERKRYWITELDTAQPQPGIYPVSTPRTDDKDRKFIGNVIVETLTAVLEIPGEEFDTEAVFTDFGVDSIFAVVIINRLNERLDLQLRATDLFNYPTIGQLTCHILDETQEGLPGDWQSQQSPRPGRRWHQPQHRQDRQQAADQGDHHWPGIAVIGMAGRFPDARDVNEFWNNLAGGKDSVREITRWNPDQYYDLEPGTPGKSNSKWGAFLSDIDQFDPLFFNISPKEAELMDPQQRLFLEEAWKALEDAGYSNKALEGTKCGVFIGVSSTDYEEILKTRGLIPDAYTFTGTSESILAGRLSYLLNLKGPAITINTACSSSLVAIHLAFESIRAGTCEMAIAGGVQVMNTPDLYIKTGRSGMLSPVGKCKTFDSSADGFVAGEGVGIVVLKFLPAALKAGDHIYGVIIGSGINQDGKTNGITAPSAPSQTALECEVYDRYGIDPGNITYVETHGTGTKLGDPIEVQALTDAFRNFTDKRQYSALGSVKTNIGHTFAAAGAAGFIKTLLCLKHQTLVPSLHFKQPNEHINFKDSPFYVNTQLQEWKTDNNVPRRAAISSFGFSGTNAHMVVEEFLPVKFQSQASSRKSQVIVLSAKNKERLNAYARKMIDFLEKVEAGPGPRPADEKQSSIPTGLRQHLQADLLKTAAAIIQVKETDISLDGQMEEYGFDAVLLALFYGRLNEIYGFEITPGSFPGDQSLAGISQYLHQTYPRILRNYYQDCTDIINGGDNDCDGSQEPARNFTAVEKKENRVKMDDVNLGQMAYTLQKGRTAMEERLALVAFDFCQVKDKLSQYLEGKNNITDFYQGNIADNRTTSELLTEGEESQEFIRMIISQGNLNKLARLWISGVDIPWECLHAGADTPVFRISLPTYPFAAEHYWAPTGSPRLYRKPGDNFYPPSSSSSLIDDIDPYLSLQEGGVVFYKTLRRTDPVVRDHRVREQCILPGVGILEMAAAGFTAFPLKFYRVVFRQPVVMQEEEKKVRVVIKKEKQSLVFQVQSMQHPGTVIHASGEILLPDHGESAPGDAALGIGLNPDEMPIPVETIKARSTLRMDKAEFYSRTIEMGVDYGPYFQGVSQLWANPREALGLFCISPPGQRELSAGTYRLHPAVLDSALQTIVGIFTAADPDHLPQVVPFSLGKVEIFSPPQARGYAYAHAADGGSHCYQVTITDENGNPWVHFHDVVFRRLPQKHLSLWEKIPSMMDNTIAHLSLPLIDTQAVERYGKAFEEMTARIPWWLLEVFQQWGVFLQQQECYQKEDLKQKLGIISSYNRWFDAVLEILGHAGILQCSGQEIVFLGPRVLEMPVKQEPSAGEQERDRLMEVFPEITPHIHLLGVCLEGFPQALTGRKSYIEIMFPGGSRSLVAGIYQGTPITDYFHRLSANIIKEYIRQRLQIDPGAQIDILEIGAGTGGTSRFVLETVSPYADHLRYWYTDISSGFTSYGEEKFAVDYSFIEFQVLDIEQPVEHQGFKPNSMDLVLASNVLHATRQMTRTLEHTRSLLKPNGILLVNEATRVHEFGTLTYGLTDGWWRFEDESSRLAGSPLLGVSQWKESLEAAGIRQVQVFQFPGTTVKEFGQCVLLAERDARIGLDEHEQDDSFEPFVEMAEPDPGAVSPGQPIFPMPREGIGDAVLDYVKMVFSEVLKIGKAKIDRDTTFERYGVDSLVGMDIIQRFEKDFDKLPPTLLFEYMTAGKLADYFLSHHWGRVTELFNPEESKKHLHISTPQERFQFTGNGSLKDKVAQLFDDEVDMLLQLLSKGSRV